MKGKILIGIIILVSALAAIAMNGFSGHIVGDADYAVRVGYKANANYLPLFVAQEKGYFSEEGVAVEAIRFDSTNAIVDAFAAGRLDATPTGNVVVSYALENAQHGLFRMYSFSFYTDERHPENLVVKKGSAIRRYADLEGKTIGANKGIFARSMLRLFLEMRGVKNFRIVELDDSVQLHALESGQIDALISLEPVPTIGVDLGIAEYLGNGSVYARTTGFTPSLSGGIVSARLLEQHPEEAKRFLRAMEKAMDFIEGDLAGSKAILPGYVPMNRNVSAKISMEEFRFVGDLESGQLASVQRTADFLHENGIIGQVNVSGLILESRYYE